MPISKKITRQLLACMPAFCVQINIGMGWGWTSPTLQKLRSDDADFRITTQEAAWLGSVCEIGRTIGPFASPLLLDNVGRKRTLVVLAILFLCIWLAKIFVRNIYILLLIRIVFGIANGVTDVASAIYVAEICSPDFRGVSGGAILVAHFVGLILEYVVATYLNFANAAIVNALLATLALTSTYLGVETTYYLTMKGKHELARDNFIWLQANHRHTDIERELQKIRKDAEEEKQKRESFRTLFSSRMNLKAIFAAVCFYLLWSSIGYHTMLLYSSLVFSPSARVTANEFTILFGVGQVIATTLSLFIVEKIDRRPLLMYTHMLISLCLMSTAALLYFHGKNYDIASYSWLLFTCITVYGFLCSLILPVAYINASELLPLSVRAIGGSMAVAASSLASFITAILFWPITERFGMEINFIIFTIMNMLVILFVYFFMPETRGKALHEMNTNRKRSEVTENREESLRPLHKPAYYNDQEN